MDPTLRTTLLSLGIAFCVIFGGLTLNAAVKLGFGVSTYGDLLGLGFLIISLLLIAMIAIGLVGAIRNPPPDE